ncbi:MAG: hypothetical protein ACLR4Z_06305 [Butyricicoccaceae bacterium]
MSDNALYYMGKPSFNVYEQFRERYARINQKLGRKQYLVPYLMSSHPGATLDDAIMLAQYLNRVGYMPEQVQDFYPRRARCPPRCTTPSIDPRTMKPVYRRKNARGKGDAACAAAMAPTGQAPDHPCRAQKGSAARISSASARNASSARTSRRRAACRAQRAANRRIATAFTAADRKTTAPCSA